MPATSEKQRKFMAAELNRAKKGEKTKTKMSEKQLKEFAKKTTTKKKKKKVSTDGGYAYL